MRKMKFVVKNGLFQKVISWMIVVTAVLVFVSVLTVNAAGSAQEEADFRVVTDFNPQTLVPNQMMTAKVTATNTSTVPYNGMINVLVIVGLYDTNNTMVNVSYISKGISYQATEVLSAGFKLPANVKGYRVKAFMWDGTDIKTSNMTPISNVVQIPQENITPSPILTPTITPTLTPRLTPTPTASDDPNTAGPSVDPSLRNKCTGTSPIKLHMDLQPGNYDVTVVLGDSQSSGTTSVEGEARRPMLGTISTKAGALSRQTFTINVRNPEGQPTGQGGTGTQGLDLVFSGSSPKVNGIGVAKSQNPSMIYLAGDSTVCDQPSAPYTGWGQMLPKYFKMGLCVANYADSGENSGSFLSNNALFPTMLKLLKANDYVFIQFGHNDKTTSASAFKANLNNMIAQCKQKGAIPVLVTPPVRRLFNSDNKTLSNTALHINSVGANLPAIMKEVASANNVKLIDLTSKSKALVESLGVEGSKSIFLTSANDGVNDNTHFCTYGANEMAKFVIQSMKDLNLPQVSMLR